MDGVREVTVIFCGAAVMAAALRLLCGNRLEKSGRYIVALIMLSAVISGIVGADIDFTPKETSLEASAHTAIALSEYQAEVAISALLDEKSLEYRNISVKATKIDEGGIIISEITIEGAGDREGILQAVRQVGIECVVVFS